MRYKGRRIDRPLATTQECHDDARQAGVDITVIALWLGHESIEATHIYLDERALEKVTRVQEVVERFKADDALLAELAKL